MSSWVEFYRQAAENGEDLSWPSETLIRLFNGDYIPDLNPNDFVGKTVLDVGFGNGNNLALYDSLGMRIAGSEVDDRLCKGLARQLKSFGTKTDLRVGTNRDLPWDDNTFDFLVSWNVLHYESDRDGITCALAEYSRVLKPGGRFFISTTAGLHKILKNAEYLGGNRRRIGRDGDFRQGEIYYCFNSRGSFQTALERMEFQAILVGQTTDFLMTATLDWFIATGVK